MMMMMMMFVGLNRDDLIMIALLVGSDYTTGLTGVGPVSAIEIVAHCRKSDNTSSPQSRLAKFIRDYYSSNLSNHLMRKLQTLEITEGEFKESQSRGDL